VQCATAGRPAFADRTARAAKARVGGADTLSRPATSAVLLVDELCSAARSRAHALGHRLGAWEDATEDEAVARRSRCRHCGSVAYVRLEDSLLGMAGDAVAQSCPGSSGPSAAGPEPTAQT
jgi:hypothetical protein